MKRAKRKTKPRCLLEDWLEVDAGPIIPGPSSFAKPDLVKP